MVETVDAADVAHWKSLEPFGLLCRGPSLRLCYLPHAVLCGLCHSAVPQRRNCLNFSPGACYFLMSPVVKL